MKDFGIARMTRRMALRDWLALVALLLVLTLALGWQNGLGRLDQTLYDTFVSATPQPRHEDVIVVAIDDYSLQQLGRWPWPRARHAALIERLTQARPRAIGLDVILTEPDSSPGRSGDIALAAAVAASTVTVLPVVISNPGTGLAVNLPVAPLASAARTLAHIDLEHDSDGVVRSVYLQETLGQRWWPYFSLALARVGAGHPADQPVLGSAVLPAPIVEPPAATATWQRAMPLHIPFAATGSFASVPYVAVLRGEVSPDFFRDKYVLIGATAMGLSDAYPTPVSGTAGTMSGIEIHANVLASLLDGRAIRMASASQTALWSMLPVLLALIGYLLLSPRLALAIAAALLMLTLALSYLAMRAGFWLPPAAAAIVLLLSYPLWSWRRLEAAINYLGQEFIRLDHEPHLLPEEPSNRRQDAIEDVLERRINAMKNAAQRVRELRKFVSNSLDNLPDTTLVTTVDGHVLVANQHANRYFGTDPASAAALRGSDVLHLLARLHAPQPIDLPASVNFEWRSMLDLGHVATLANGVGATDGHNRDLLVKSAPCFSTAQTLTGWIVSITDISPIRAAERSRDETLRFLSHDMRAPQASILALLELQTDAASALPQPEFFARIERATRRTLGLADNFVQLARAESHDYRLDEVDFRDLLFDATDEMWMLARAKQITIATEIDDSADYPVVVDRALMTRALVNLLSNAINYSPEQARIVCHLALKPGVSDAVPVLSCCISDSGYGIALADQKRLFQRFARVELPDQPRQDGIGLGLVFVKTVVERHQGNIGFVSAPGAGTSFTILLPCQRLIEEDAAAIMS